MAVVGGVAGLDVLAVGLAVGGIAGGAVVGVLLIPQLLIALFGGQQGVVVGDLCLQLVVQRVVSGAGSGDLGLAVLVQLHLADGVDLGDHIVHGGLVGGFLLQLGQLGLGVGQDIQLADQRLLGVGQGVVSLAGSVDLGLAVVGQGHVADGVDQVVNILGGGLVGDLLCANGQIGQHLGIEGVLVGFNGGLHLVSSLGGTQTGDAVLGAFLADGAVQIEAVVHIVCRGLIGGQAAQIGGSAAGAGNITDAVAVGQGRAIRVAEAGAADTTQIALVFGSGGDIAAGVAVGDDRATRGIARDAACVLIAGDVHGAPALGNGCLVVHIAHDAARLRNSSIVGAGHAAGDAQPRDGGAALQITDQAQSIAGAVDVQVADNVTLSIEGTVELLQRCPIIARQLDIGGELGAAFTVRGGEPCQLRSGADQIHAVAVLLGLGLGLAVPSVFTDLGQNGGLDSQDAVLHIGGVSAAQREGAAGDNIAVLGQGIGINAIAQGVGAVFVGGNRGLAIAAQQGDGHAVHGLAVFIGDVQLGLIGDLLIHRNHRVSIVVHVIVDGHSIEVSAHAGIGHAIQESEGVGSSIHAAVGIAVGKGVLRGGRAIGEGHILWDGDGDGGVVHLLVLAQRTLVLGLTGEIGGLEDSGIEDAGDLVDGAVHAVKAQLYLIAGHDILAGVGDILSGDGDLGHAHQTVADAGGVGHLEDNGAALAVADGVEASQRNGVIAVSVGGNGLEAGNGGLHAVVGGSQRVFHLHAAGGVDSEVQRRVRLTGFIEPCVVVIVPILGAGSGDAGSHVVLHLRVGGAVGHAGTAHHDDAHTLRAGGGEQAAVAAVIAGVHVHAVIVDGDDGILRTGGNVRPVGGGVTAVNGADRSIADQGVPVEVRLHHDVARVGVDELPVTVGADTGSAGNGFVAAGVQIDL